MTGLEIADGGVYDFYVIFMGEMMNFHLVTIPGGTYEMGEEWGDIVISWPGPAHQVALDDFEISAYETTNYQYAQFLNEALAAGEIEMINGDPYGKGGEWDGKRLIDLDTHLPEFMPVEAQCYIKFSNGSFSVMESIRRNWPVVAVNWYGAKAFASHYGLDLPTEAEWEYAAGGGILEYEYATDDGTLDRLKANYNFAAIGPNEKDLRHVLEIGSYPPNPFGLFDMTGNIKEWCNDWYVSYPSLYNETLDWHDTHIPPSYVIVNPTGPDRMDGSKIIRGGSFDTGIQFPLPECRTTYRYFLKPTGTIGSHNEIEYELGFRVARRPSPTAKAATP